ncbi:MAG: Gldg family protein, partial [Planctomycetes bacterium]|nr:Gldg family protein [Planctomycetota bacterium]
ANLRVHLVDADVEVDTPNRWSRELSLGKGQLVNHLVFHDAKSKRKEVYSLFRLFDLDLGGRRLIKKKRRPESRGDFIEMHLVQALRSLTSERTRIAGLAAGQGEIPLLVLRQLFEGWDVDVRDLPLDQGQAIPQDLDFLVIASPERDWRPESLEQVRRWFEAGGRILLLQGSRCRELHRDLLASVGLRPLAAQVGHPTQHERARGLYHLAGYRLLQPTEGQSAHAITSTAVRDALPIELGFARPYDLLSDYESDRVTRNMVMHSSEGGLLMPWIHDGKDWRQAEDRGTKQGDFLLAAAVERAPGPGGGEPGRMVVIGSDEWLDGRLLLGGFNLANLDVLSNTVDWLTGRDRRIFGTPRSFRGDLAKLDRDSIRGFRYLTVGILPGMLVLMGLLVFLLRRR